MSRLSSPPEVVGFPRLMPGHAAHAVVLQSAVTVVGPNLYRMKVASRHAAHRVHAKMVAKRLIRVSPIQRVSVCGQVRWRSAVLVQAGRA
jgi:hypothetical protein